MNLCEYKYSIVRPRKSSYVPHFNCYLVLRLIKDFTIESPISLNS